MTKEQFLAMVSSEIERLEAELKVAQGSRDYYKELATKATVSPVTIEIAAYQINFINQQLAHLRNFLEYPAYARIQAMSDTELIQHRQEQVEMLELSIKEQEALLKQAEEEYKSLKLEESKIVREFSQLEGQDRQNAISRGQELANKISDYEGSRGKFVSIQAQIDSLKQELEAIRTKTPEQIRTDLSSKISNAERFEQNRNRRKEGLVGQDKMIAAVASDPEKARKMSFLMSQYYEIITYIQKDRGRVFYDLPSDFSTSVYGQEIFTLSQLGQLLADVSAYEKKFEKEKKRFEETFDLSKISGLIGKIGSWGSVVKIDISSIDWPFLEQHSDKLTAGKLDELKLLSERKDKLSKKILKTRSVKDEIYDLERRIRVCLSEIYKEISAYYKKVYKEFERYGYIPSLSFEDEKQMTRAINGTKERLESVGVSIEQVKERISKAQEALQKRKDDAEQRAQEKLREMQELSGVELSSSSIYVSERQSENLDSVMRGGAYSSVGKVMDRVDAEALEQSLKDEAALSGMTVEQLRQLRQEVVSNPAEAVDSAAPKIM